MMYLHEIFCSIQGEGYDTGLPTTFVRFYGCNVKCVYCDQPQCTKDQRRVSIDNILGEVRKFGVKRVCLTGGEPLLQKDIYPLVYELLHMDYEVSIETNGTIPLQDVTYNRSYKYVMDVKCPSSGVSAKNNYDNLGILHYKDEVKFVIKDREDYEFMKNVLKKYPTKAKILASPMFDENLKPLIGPELVQWLIDDRLDNVKVSLQVHKFMGVL